MFFDDGSGDPTRSMARALLEDEQFAPFLRNLAEDTLAKHPKGFKNDVTKRVARNHIFKAISEAVEANVASKTTTVHPTTKRMFYFRSRNDRLEACLIATDRVVRSMYD
jgi:hypothetical protein